MSDPKESKLVTFDVPKDQYAEFKATAQKRGLKLYHAITEAMRLFVVSKGGK
jgi:hypothetical protein